MNREETVKAVNEAVEAQLGRKEPIELVFQSSVNERSFDTKSYVKFLWNNEEIHQITIDIEYWRKMPPKFIKESEERLVKEVVETISTKIKSKEDVHKIAD